METIEIEVYGFDELEESAKERAYENWADGREYHWDDDNFNSLHAFADLMSCEIRRATYGGRGEGVDYTCNLPDDVQELSGRRAATWLWNNLRNELWPSKIYWNGPISATVRKRVSNIQRESFPGCSLTGYCVDNTLLLPLLRFAEEPDDRTIRDLIDDAFSAWVRDCSEDMFWSLSREYFEENEAGMNKYFKNGEIYE